MLESFWMEGKIQVILKQGGGNVRMKPTFQCGPPHTVYLGCKKRISRTLGWSPSLFFKIGVLGRVSLPFLF